MLNDDFITYAFGPEISVGLKLALGEKQFKILSSMYMEASDYICDIDGFLINAWMDKTARDYYTLTSFIETELLLEEVLEYAVKGKRKELKQKFIEWGYGEHDVDIQMHEDPETLVDYMSLLELVREVNTILRKIK